MTARSYEWRDVCPFCGAAFEMPADGSESAHGCARMPIDWRSLARRRLISNKACRTMRRWVLMEKLREDSPERVGPFLPEEPPPPVLLGDLAEYDVPDLVRFEGFGEASIERLRDWLRSQGLEPRRWTQDQMDSADRVQYDQLVDRSYGGRWEPSSPRGRTQLIGFDRVALDPGERTIVDVTFSQRTIVRYLAASLVESSVFVDSIRIGGEDLLHARTQLSVFAEPMNYDAQDLHVFRGRVFEPGEHLSVKIRNTGKTEAVVTMALNAEVLEDEQRPTTFADGFADEVRHHRRMIPPSVVDAVTRYPGTPAASFEDLLSPGPRLQPPVLPSAAGASNLASLLGEPCLCGSGRTFAACHGAGL